METPLLYRQLQDQLSQWVQPKDQRHLQGFAEIVAAVLQTVEQTAVGLGALGEVRPVGDHSRRSNSIGREPLSTPRTSLSRGVSAGVR